MKMITIPTDVGKTRRHTRGAQPVAPGHHGLIPWLIKTVALLAILICPTLANGQAIKVKNLSLNNGDAVSTVSELTIEFDFSEAAESTGVEESLLGIGSMMEDFITYRMLLYKGDPSEAYIGENQDPDIEGNIISYGYFTIGKKNIVSGMHSITIPLVNPVELSEGSKYTLYLPEGLFYAGVPGTLYKATIYNEPIIIELVGASGNSDEGLKLVSVSPSTEEAVPSLNEITLEYDVKVAVEGNASVNLTLNGEVCNTSSSIYVVDTTVHIIFDNADLYTGNDYILEIPAGLAKSIDGSSESAAINLFYKGCAFHYLTSGRIKPSSNSSLSWLSQISIPFTFPEGYNIGNTSGDLVKLYEGRLDMEPQLLSCTSDNANTLIVDAWKFDLKPNTTYYLVLDEGQIFPCRADNYRIKLKDTTNPRIELTYTTPDVLETPAKVAINSVPEHQSECERLDEVTLNLEPYEFEDTPYDIYLATDEPKTVFSDGTTETSVPLTFTNGSTTAKVSLNRPLEAGKEYTLTIPANTFIPNAHENLAAVAGNEEKVFSFIGKDKEIPDPEFVSITLNVGDYASATYRMVKGEESVIDLKGGNDWKLESLTLNGDDVTSEVAENGLYTLPALDEDATLDAIYGYAHVIDFDFTTGVGQVEECPYGVGKDGSHVVITGLKGGDNIAVYTVGGMKVAELPAVPADMDEASIVLPENQVYVILINATAIKYKH